ncbi:MAG: hypothetical protein ABIT01_03395, partial [Thermoanaerobaculia bacterium]
VAERPAPAPAKVEVVRTETPVVAEKPVRRLPKTAGAGSVWTVLGLLSVAAALSLRAMSRRAN